MSRWNDAGLEPFTVGLRVASWRDFWRLNRLLWSGLGIAALRSVPFVVALSILTLMLVLLVVSTAVRSPGLLPGALAYVGLTVTTMFALMGVLVSLHCALRLADRHRWLLLSSDRTAVLDVILSRRRDGWRITPANHMKLRRSGSAAALRISFADWMQCNSRDDVELGLVAQNRRVAALYASQFPQLEVISRRDWVGRVSMGAREPRA